MTDHTTDHATPTHRDDASLQGWGRNLSTIAPALAEAAGRDSAAAAESHEIASAIGRLAQQGEAELPASNVVVAEAQAVAAEARKLAAEQEDLAKRRRALANRAEQLPTTYRREHETDEDRLAGGRGGREREKRADVGTAERDT